jgi:hypothetical protein
VKTTASIFLYLEIQIRQRFLARFVRRSRFVILKNERNARMSLTDDGKGLVEKLKLHVLQVMQGFVACQPAGPGIGKSKIEKEAGLDLGLEKLKYAWHGYLCHGILLLLEREGKVENCGKSRHPLWRLRRKNSCDFLNVL